VAVPVPGDHRDGNLVDVYLSETRDQEAAEALFRSAVAVTGTTPDKVTTDKHASYPSTRSSAMTSNTALQST
jgi:transposase-like protein